MGKPNHAVFEEPRMGALFGFVGLIGIAIPLMDHKFTLLGFLICWASALAVPILYYPQWKAVAKRVFGKPGYQKKICGRDFSWSSISLLL